MGNFYFISIKNNLSKMAFYGVQLDVMVRELNLKFKLNIQQKGGVGIRALRRIFN